MRIAASKLARGSVKGADAPDGGRRGLRRCRQRQNQRNSKRKSLQLHCLFIRRQSPDLGGVGVGSLRSSRLQGVGASHSQMSHIVATSESSKETAAERRIAGVLSRPIF